MKMELIGYNNQYMVYLLTYDCNTGETAAYLRITQGGVIELQQPIFIP